MPNLYLLKSEVMNGEAVHEAVGSNIFVNVYDSVSVCVLSVTPIFLYFVKEDSMCLQKKIVP